MQLFIAFLTSTEGRNYEYKVHLGTDAIIAHEAVEYLFYRYYLDGLRHVLLIRGRTVDIFDGTWN